MRLRRGLIVSLSFGAVVIAAPVRTQHVTASAGVEFDGPVVLPLPTLTWRGASAIGYVRHHESNGSLQEAIAGARAPIGSVPRTLAPVIRLRDDTSAAARPDQGADAALTAFPYPVSQQAYLKASNTGTGDRFGSSVALSGDTAVIGAPHEASNATGVNGSQGNNFAFLSGAAYVFVRNIAGYWTQQAYLKASNTSLFDRFGSSVALSGDTIVVGAPAEDSNATGVNGNQADNSATDSGAAYVFVRSGGVWTQQAYLKASNTQAGDLFGTSVAVSGDTIVVGAPAEASNATGVDGNQGDNSAAGAGAAYVFQRTAGVWTQAAYVKASNTGANDAFAESVAVSGNTVVVGAAGEDSSATGIGGNQGNNSAADAGAAYVFVNTGATWIQEAYLKASNAEAGDNFGGAVAISSDTIVVGADLERSGATGVDGNQLDNSASSSGAAYVFVGDGGAWSQEAYLKASHTDPFDRFGQAVAVSGSAVVVGAFPEDSNATGVNGDGSDNSALSAGATYAFVRSGGTWSHQAYLKASNTDPGDNFGYSVGVSGYTMLVGANVEASIATGVDGDQASDTAAAAGAAYVFAGLSLPEPTLDPVPAGTLTIGATNTLTGTNFSAGTVIKLFINSGATIEDVNPSGFVPSSVTPTSLTWTIPSTVPLGQGFGSVYVVNTDEGFTTSNTQYALLFGSTAANIPTITGINGIALASTLSAGVPVAYVETVVTPGDQVTISGIGFNNPGFNLYAADLANPGSIKNYGPIFPGGSASTQQFTIPANVPAGPINFQAVNSPYSGNVQSNAVSSLAGALVTITSVVLNGNTVTVNGTGFSPLSVINLYNKQDDASVVNLGGLNGTTPKVPLTFVNATQFTFTRPAGAQAGPSFLEVINPPFIPYTSSGTDPAGGADPDGAFSFP